MRPPGEPPAAIIVRFCHDEVVRQISGLRSISSIKTKIKLHFLPADVEFNTFQSKQSNSIFAHFHPAMNNNGTTAPPEDETENEKEFQAKPGGPGGAGNFSLIIVYLGWARVFT